jgi:anti-sigma B factor antagonist
MVADPERPGTMPGLDRDLLLSSSTPVQPDSDGAAVLRIAVRRTGGVTMLTVVGDVDLASAPTFDDHIARCLDSRTTTLVLDLTGVTFLGTAGLAALVRANSQAGPDCQLRVVAATRIARRPLQLTELDQLLAVYPTREAATADLDLSDTN